MITYRIVQAKPLVQADGSQVDERSPPDGAAPGTPYATWRTVFTGCVDITDLNPGPTPEEVFRYFQTLPLPEPTTRQQPPGNALVGLPVIFYTDTPATAEFTVDIRGFTVVIDAAITTYTWTTGDGSTLVTTTPGAPYPDETVTHDYTSGTYTAGLTTTWGGTYTVDGGAVTDVAGTTTTDGPPVTFTVLQARPVLTDPTD
ncbi:hypothetical protein GB931_20740 [Modestobacter sp. I12A-02628]|uniref:PKD domain-containing protein n=1 Tax=Goekera deserti TaxID=2497753 RepID=A0A7K3W859_9ACTN|nr:hypothetical protein [Goekera deserti]MPR00301.1 hypothetical protein [Goekera deserti]NDI49475.1 hypothetical protein [Goekera deserti]NEL52651.1 hypothetical protein [Goekera deserti]